ncbi:hypothetical protein IW261DRAFT_1421281 [Armillaria novae-zelandiae]|uniref:Uncharacterized protein n=1 Tax=Armillaria novae-zelandiae TaxID=153914 RepID=A0AA39UFT6_9AGAR|nr:hypothetical protein IW261DRAFT_1421281 [Armillaria novae-zelandiae]
MSNGRDGKKHISAIGRAPTTTIFGKKKARSGSQMQVGMRLQYQRDPNGCYPSVIIVDNPPDALRLGAHAASPPRLRPRLNLPPEADSETDGKPARLRLVLRVRKLEELERQDGPSLETLLENRKEHLAMIHSRMDG